MRRDGEQDRACASVCRGRGGSEWDEAGLLDSAHVTRVLAEMRWLGTGLLWGGIIMARWNINENGNGNGSGSGSVEKGDGRVVCEYIRTLTSVDS